MQCIICERELEPAFEGAEERCQPDGGGSFALGFSYGSRHDQLNKDPDSEDRMTKLLSSDWIMGYFCDDCFEKKHHLLEGYHTLKLPTWERVV
jgi:hypothetical protein